MGSGKTGHRQRSLVLCMLLAALSLSAYLPLRNNGFINCDDPEYVSENPVVQNKLTINGVKWAFEAPRVANYHPITWLSHMLDVTLFGVNPGPHHLMSLELHVLN